MHRAGSGAGPAVSGTAELAASRVNLAMMLSRAAAHCKL